MRPRILAIGAVAALSGLLAACGSGGAPGATGGNSGGGTGGTGSAATYKPGGTLTVEMGTAPDSLDPQLGYTTQAAEADWLVYTPLLTYAHKSGQAGGQVIPGLAQSLPKITNGGKTYTVTLRKGLEFSNGTPVKASDFTYSIERAIKLQWGGDSFFTGNIAGASAYQSGKSNTISGIKTDNSTGKITINLTKAYGAFDNVLAFPSAGLVPSNTPMKALSANPPVGDGAYEFTNVKPNASFSLKKNPHFAAQHIPGIPDGYVNKIDVTIQSNNVTEAQNVLNNTSDEFDWGDTLPSSLLGQIQSQAKNRYTPETVAETSYFFLNTRTKPFNNIKARKAVYIAVNRTDLQRLASGQAKPACYFLPPAIVGHPSGPCPNGQTASQLGSPKDVAQAKKLVKQAGLAGTKVTVWSETRSPRQQFCEYLTTVLNKIGFKASIKVISDSIYFQTIGSAKTNPQIGFADWLQDFPNPADFYLLLDARAIQPVNNENFSNVDDPHIQKEIKKLDKVPASQLKSVASQWAALDKYSMGKYYMVPFGNEIAPFFLSNKVDYKKAVFQPQYGDDWSTFELKA